MKLIGHTACLRIVLLANAMNITVKLEAPQLNYDGINIFGVTRVGLVLLE